MIRVVIAEDHGLVRAGLEELLENAPDIELVGSANNGESLLRTAAQVAPDVVLMDLSMPGMDGVEATRRLRDTDEHVQIVVLTAFSDRSRILAALDAGATGYLLKDTEPEELYRGIRAAARGESPLAPKAARVVLSARGETRADPLLTEREREVLVLVASGLANKVVARRLGISEKTVKNHVTHILHALGLTDRTQAALWAQREGLL
jgi:DNA-binding NarL/FixJ family response regulator